MRQVQETEEGNYEKRMVYGFYGQNMTVFLVQNFHKAWVPYE
jgi:hypothetical protein